MIQPVLRRARSRDIECLRMVLIRSAQQTGKFECDYCTHAVSEKRERLLQMRNDRVANRGNQRVEVIERRLGDPAFPTRETCRADRHRIRRATGPITEHSSSCSGTRAMGTILLSSRSS